MSDAANIKSSRFDEMLSAVDTAVVELDADGTYLGVWTENEKLLSRPKADLLGRRIDEVLGETGALALLGIVRAVIETGERQETEYRGERVDGPRIFHARIGRIEQEGRHTALMVVRDITDQRRSEVKWKEREERLRLVIQGTSDGVWDWDPVTNDEYLSPRWKEILGFEDDELPNLASSFFDRIHPDDAGMVQEAVQRHFEHDEPYQVEMRLCHKDESYRWVLSRGGVIRDAEGQPIRMVGTITDITDRKRSESALLESQARLRASLHEKETLLREVHHRVKNNLQIIKSLLYFESKKVTEPESLSVLREAEGRLRAMILVHEKLYQSDTLANVDFEEYLQSLAQDLRDSYAMMQSDIDLSVEVSSLSLPIDVALPLGMIVNELLANAFKYAFPAGRHGKIRVESALEGNLLQLTVGDDGVGWPPGQGPDTSQGFGFRMVRTLTEQLNGSLTFETACGTLVTLEVPIHEA